MKPDNTVCVIGGGPAGMMAAITAARAGVDIVLVEKKRRPGIKLSITGKGRCNFTNACGVDEMISEIPGNGRFLYSAITALSPDSLVDFFRDLGVESVVERGGRVFPSSDSAVEIVSALIRELERTRVDVRVGWKVTAIAGDEASLFSILSLNRPEIRCREVVVATGGITYPQTGSTGDGYDLLRAVGHTIVTPRVSLVSLTSETPWIGRLQGLSLRNVRAMLFADSEQIQAQFGEILFTGSGLSGPVILTLSRQAVKLLDEHRQVSVSIDLKPALDDKTLDDRLVRDLQEASRKSVRRVLERALPRLLVPVFAELCEIDLAKRCAQVTREERKRMVSLLKEFRVPVSGYGSPSEAIVTQGGIDVKEINPSTMESRIVSGLHVCGELLDVDGYTGGFNLHAAFATGFVAGRSTARRVKVLSDNTCCGILGSEAR